MKNKFFIPFKNAKALKEIGYPQFEDDSIWCGLHYYTETGQKLRGCDLIAMKESIKDNYCVAPTYHEVIDWFEEKYKLYINISYLEDNIYGAEIFHGTNHHWYIEQIANSRVEALNEAIDNAIKFVCNETTANQIQ